MFMALILNVIEVIFVKLLRSNIFSFWKISTNFNNTFDFKDNYLIYSKFNNNIYTFNNLDNLFVINFFNNKATMDGILNNYSSKLNTKILSLSNNKFKVYTSNLVKFNLDVIKNNLKLNTVIKFAPSSMLKYVSLNNISQYTILFLRKNKVFNKGRYSRNRQYYRTGVYWCLYINIIAVIGIYYWFYKLTFNFGYMWWLLYVFIASFIVPKAIKYRLYNIKTLLNSFYLDIRFLGFVYINFINYLKKLISSLNNIFNVDAIYSLYFSKSLNFFSLLLGNFKFIYINTISNFYQWEYTNLNYYYKEAISVTPVYFEKLKSIVSNNLRFLLK